MCHLLNKSSTNADIGQAGHILLMHHCFESLVSDRVENEQEFLELGQLPRGQ